MSRNEYIFCFTVNEAYKTKTYIFIQAEIFK